MQSTPLIYTDLLGFTPEKNRSGRRAIGGGRMISELPNATKVLADVINFDYIQITQ